MTNLLKILVIIFGAITLLLIVSVIFIYFSVFNGSLTTDIEYWSGAGSYFGGIIGAALTFLTTLLLIYTASRQYDEIKREKLNQDYNQTVTTFFNLLNHRQSLLVTNMEGKTVLQWLNESKQIISEKTRRLFNDKNLEKISKDFDKYYPYLSGLIATNIQILDFLNKKNQNNEYDNLIKLYTSTVLEAEKYIVFIYLFAMSDKKEEENVVMKYLKLDSIQFYNYNEIIRQELRG